VFHHLDLYEALWLVLGFTAQARFGGRFLVQWLHSEKHRRSVVPIMFWWLSVIGGLMMLIYSIHKRDPVFISGQAFGLIVYSRNIWLLNQERKISRERVLTASTR
jgi:lipid-A-disaccharide synthase-like uncharacterized protein